MKKFYRGLLAVLLVISLLISLCPAVFAAPSSTLITTPATGYDSADDVVYKTYNGYLINWGARGEECEFLTTYAQDFYTGSYAYSTLSRVAGGTNTSNAHSSSLYTSLQTLMTDRHTYLTKYDTSSSADCKPLYQNADCYGNDITYVSTLYRGLKVGGAWDGGKSYNQEHVWPKSKLKGTKYTDIGDIMALRAAYPNENSSRNNTAYGESSGYYDPGISVRGDCARTLLYMYVRWGNTDTFWGTEGSMESLDILLRWIQEDPVDTWEMAHNDVVQSITGTRNAFIDYPEYAWLLFGRSIPANLETPSDGGSTGGAVTDTAGATQLLTGNGSLQAGDRIIIAALNYDYALSTEQRSSNRGQAAVTKTSNGLNYSTDTQIFTLTAGKVSGTFGLQTEDGQYLYASSSSANQLKTKSTLDGDGSWRISISASGAASITASGAATRNVMRYNATSSVFSCYAASNSQKDVCIYKLWGSGGSAGASCSHSYTSKITTAAGCTSTGVRTYTCSMCSDSYTATISATGHSYTDRVTTMATCTSTGVRTYTCSSCGYSYTTTIPVMGHSFSGTTCTVCGYSTACSHSYKSSVTRAATCISTGIKTYTCSKCGDSYTETIATTAHSYYAGTCTVCGVIDSSYSPDYYLFGYINGANYACEEDSANLGIYKFENGRLTATFKTEGYVGVKTGDNANWYMTGGWMGTDATSAVLYNTKVNANPDKLFVPGGVELTFTLVNNGDDTLFLSYETTTCVHSYTSYVSIEPGCTTDGQRTYICSRCGDSYTKVVAATGHSYSGNRCTVCGYSLQSMALVTSTSELQFGDQIIIAAKDYNYALGVTQNTSNRAQAAITKSGSTMTCGADTQIITLTTGTVSGTFAFRTDGGYLYAASSSSNQLKSTTSANANGAWSISIASDGTATVKARGTATRNILRYNATSGLFSCYSSSSSQADICIYKLTTNARVCDHSYSSVVSRQPTCLVTGVRTLSCSKCADSYVEIIPLSDHSYVGGKCTLCGATDGSYAADYYLFGFINGANYACEDDHANLGQYKFVGGKLTATFETEGYVGVKTGDNVHWYMTEGWQGMETTSVTLYNTGRLTNPDKLYVPGGVTLTFTLTVNSDDTLTLSYTQNAAACEHRYITQVTTSATCIREGLRTFTCANCGDSYTQSIPVADHSYSGGKCSVCGAVDPDYNTDYYLFGFINGANYACEDDHANLGQYKFVGGKLTATFETEGYVGVKTGDNANWYMTEGWQGMETTSVTLYNTGRLSNPDKLYVPGGVELTFTLTVNSDDTLTLSYTQNAAACEHRYITQVTTSATCIREGLRTFTCANCGDSYTESIPASGHSYVGGSCTVCGMADPSHTTDYYLFGYINGANYACEDDYTNLGQYKFVGGKLTAKFDTEGYIGVKTGDNASWYMTNGWQGTEVTSATLYNTGRLTNPDKLYVPGGVTLTFTLTVNSDDTLTLSYAPMDCSHNYTSRVTTAATCVSEGLRTFTCANCGDSYTESIPASGHSYVGGSCTVCGMADPSHTTDYYLFGFINGSNYACEEDFENLGIYKFVNGKLTTTFDVEGYIGVKTGDNASWYMTNGWQGTEVTSATLYNTGRLTNPDKLYVPGGVTLTFTLTVNSDDTLTLSYAPMDCSHNYTSRVTTAATCTTTGVNAFTCLYCGHSYTETLAPVSHSYVGGSCSVCGIAEPTRNVDYYLFGFINGANYACEEDSESTGNYKFENGTLTAAFLQDSYIGVKTGDNANWYMTNGWQGTEATSVTLYGTGRLTDPDKLYVPGGVEVTFTLVANADGTLTLSYTLDGGCDHAYICQVTTAATCTTPGVNTYICTNCGDSYTRTVGAPGHSFQANVCSVCGLVDTDNPAENYYLFGFINGADCGYDSDLESLGYKFVDGKVVVSFSEESYVAVKTGDNARWYYTAGWMGTETTTTTLYNSTTLSAEYKLYVPGGAQLIFTLIENGDDTLTLSYTLSGCVYQSQITQAATCTNSGVETYTCSDCGQSYTQDIPATGHSYANGSCAFCGQADPSYGVDYYLFGYINGTDYGGESDWDNVGSYKFEGGRLTATFDTDSYVGVKTGDNSVWYMTEGWQSFNANLVTLYPAGQLTNPDKLFIPGGVPMVFTLIVNSDGSLSLACVPDRCVHSYTSLVTLEPTCTTDGEITYSCDNCSNFYTEVLAATGHSYSGSSCTVCGSQIESRGMGNYYLFGYIDGRDYGCESDWNNLGNFRFSGNNTCSVTFASDSYVGVKKVNPYTGEVEGWYMTNGWLGFDARNAILANTQYLRGNADKLFVPGGTRLTFVLVENADGTLTLSYGNVHCEHTYDSGKITTRATCLEQGIRAYTCTLCGHFYEQTIAATGHSCFNGVCIDCGAADPNEGCCANHNYLLSMELLPTCTQTGIHTAQAACGATYTEVLPATGHSYNARVATAATCDLPGLKTFTCSCGDTYSEPIDALGHRFENGFCTVCGAEESSGNVTDQSYYLFGSINGMDYGCGDDWENLGQYKFVGDQLTVTFETDSYVGIKTGDNGSWFMTDHFATETSATFYDTLTGVYEKMYVPGGVQVTFTLVENADGTLNLSYTTTGAGSSVILPNFTLKYPSLSFKDEVKVNVYYDATDLDSVVDMGLIVFSSKVGSYTVYNAEDVVSGYQYSKSAGLYVVSTNGIPAKNMGDTVWFAVYAQLSNGTYAYSKLVDYSPCDYAYTMLGSGDAKLDALLVAMLNYGTAAQTYFGYNTGSLLNNRLTSAQKALVTAYSKTMMPDIAAPSAAKQGKFVANGGFDEKYPSVTFGGAFAINYYCVPSYVPSGSITMYYWREADYNATGVLTAENATGMLKMSGNGTYKGSVTGISAKDLGDGVYVAFVYSDGSTTYCSGVLPYSIGMYCKTMAGYQNDFTPFAKATAVYGYYAKQYFG